MSYTCFWRKDSPFSNFYLSSYTLNNIKFFCTEQGIMYEKAKLFDPSGAELRNIMTATDPVYIKNQGRKVKNFKDKTWTNKVWSLVYPHLYAKFQNHKLKKLLLDTGNTILVEASPFDRIWGVGMKEFEIKNPLNKNKLQKRLEEGNLLGKLLMEVRKNIKAEETAKK